jgi:hypothetical protein
MKTKLLSLILALACLCPILPAYAAGDASVIESYQNQENVYLIGELSAPDYTILLLNTFQDERIFRLVKVNADGSTENLTDALPDTLIVGRLLELRPEENLLFVRTTTVEQSKNRTYMLNLNTLECREVPLSALSDLPNTVSFNEIFPPAKEGADRAVIVFPEKNASASLTKEEIDRLLSVEREFTMDLVVTPKKAKEDTFFVNFYIGHQAYTVSLYGDVPYASFGEHNSIWFMPYVGNARNAIYTAYSAVERAHFDTASDPYEPPATLSIDALKLPADEWAVEEVKRAADSNLLPYSIASRYREPITRSQFCDLAVQLLIQKEHPGSSSRAIYMQSLEDLFEKTLGTREPDLSMSFTDLEYPSTEISYLAALDVIHGRDDGSFDPDGTITRQEAAKILSRLAQLYVQASEEGDSADFSDAGQWDEWAKPYILWVLGSGIMQGTGNGQFSPHDTYTRQQAITTMNRLFAYLADIPSASSSIRN